MSGGHPGHYRGFIWACAEFEASLAQRRLHGLFTYADFKCCEAMLLSLLKRLEEVTRNKRFDGPLKRRAESELRHCEVLFEGYIERVFDVFDGSTYH